MADIERDESLQQKPCPICGAEAFRWGEIGVGNSYGPIFNEDEKPSGFFAQPRQVRLVARECSRCGNLQWFTRE